MSETDAERDARADLERALRGLIKTAHDPVWSDHDGYLKLLKGIVALLDRYEEDK